LPASLACIPCLSHLLLLPASLALPSLRAFLSCCLSCLHRMDRAATRPLPALFNPPEINTFRGGESEGISLLMPLVVVVAVVALQSRLILQYPYSR
jgi:hypothetical protein